MYKRKTRFGTLKRGFFTVHTVHVQSSQIINYLAVQIKRVYTMLRLTRFLVHGKQRNELTVETQSRTTIPRRATTTIEKCTCQGRETRRLKNRLKKYFILHFVIGISQPLSSTSLRGGKTAPGPAPLAARKRRGYSVQVSLLVHTLEGF